MDDGKPSFKENLELPITLRRSMLTLKPVTGFRKRTKKSCMKK
jgi:hypothetical protein